MIMRFVPVNWQGLFWKVISNPTVEVVAVLAIVGISVWAMFNTEAIFRTPHVPMWFGHM